MYPFFPDDNVVFASGKFTGSSSGITENKASNLTASRTSTGVYAFAFQNRIRVQRLISQ